MADDEEAVDNEAQEEPARPLGWRDLPSVVSIRDFAQMVGNEVEQIGSSTKRALDSLFHLPFGPIWAPISLLILAVRSCLLVLVVFVFGTGIVLVTLLRALGLFSRKRSSDD